MTDNNLERMKTQIILLPNNGKITSKELKERFPLEDLFVCDFYVDDCEKGELKPYGIIHEGIINIDHHAPISFMRKHISSTNLAIEYVKANKPVQSKILINHTDCDSMLSSMILGGYIAPDEKFARAAVNADHMGRRDDISDLLGELGHKRDIILSATELYSYLDNKKSENFYNAILKKDKERKEIKRIVDNELGRYKGIAYAIIDKNYDSGMFLPFLNDSTALVLGYKEKGKWMISVRLIDLNKGINLNELNLPDFGGRWNAGATKRHGGTDHDPQEYARLLSMKIQKI